MIKDTWIFELVTLSGISAFLTYLIFPNGKYAQICPGRCFPYTGWNIMGQEWITMDKPNNTWNEQIWQWCPFSSAVGDKKSELPIFYAISFYQIPFFNGGWQLQLRYFSQTQKKNLGALKMKVALLRSFNHPAGVRNGKEWTTGKLRFGWARLRFW